MGVLGFKHWPSECLNLDWMGMTIFWFSFFVVKYQPICHLIPIETWISWSGKKHTLIAKRENILKDSEKLVHRRTCNTCKSILGRDLVILNCFFFKVIVFYLSLLASAQVCRSHDSEIWDFTSGTSHALQAQVQAAPKQIASSSLFPTSKQVSSLLPSHTKQVSQHLHLAWQLILGLQIRPQMQTCRSSEKNCSNFLLSLTSWPDFGSKWFCSSYTFYHFLNLALEIFL